MLSFDTIKLGDLEDLVTETGMSLDDMIRGMSSLDSEAMPEPAQIIAAAMLASLANGKKMTRDEARNYSLGELLELVGEISADQESGQAPNGDVAASPES